MIDIIKELQEGEENFLVEIHTESLSVYRNGKHYIGYRFHYLSDSWVSNKGRAVTNDEMLWFIKHY